MKHYNHLIIFLCACVVCSCVSIQRPPQWVIDYRSVYPDSVYIAQQAQGSNPQQAQTEAAAALAFYFQTSVQTKREANYHQVQLTDDTDSFTYTKKEATTDTVLTADVTLSTVEYTEPWFSAHENLWYCTAFLNREKAWKQHQTVLQAAQESVLAYYYKAQQAPDPFESVRYFGFARIEGKKFLDLLSYAQLLSEEKTNAAYQEIRPLLSALTSEQQEKKNMCPVFITVDKDADGTVFTAVSAAFEKIGFAVTRKKDANCRALVSVKYHTEQDGELFIIKPSVSITVESGGTVRYSFSDDGLSCKAYSKNTAQRKARSAITASLQEKLFHHFNGNVEH